MDTFRLEVATSDSTRGTVSGSGTYLNMSRHWIEATGSEGYRFAHWNDGNRDNPREVMLTQDTLFTAYFVELSQVYVNARGNDDSRGAVTGGGVYNWGDTATLTATALPRYRYSCWDDTVCDNPRQVVLTQDTEFTAIFVARSQYRVEATSNNSDRGHVEGGGVYYEEDTVTLKALPWTLYGFQRWDDGDTANPRQFVVTQDTVFTAIFVSREGIGEEVSDGQGLQLQPNPTSGVVRCVLSGREAAGGTLIVSDVQGREAMCRPLEPQVRTVELDVSHLAKGLYFVTVTTPAYTSTRKLVVE